MKKTLVTLMTLAAASFAFAQGSFDAYNTEDAVTSNGQGLVHLNSIGGPLATDQYSVAIYWGLVGTAENDLQLLADTPLLGEGLWYIGTLTPIAAPATSPASISVQLRGYLTANPTGPAQGRSSIVTQPLAYGTAFPPALVSTGPWAIVVPEPSTFALAGLGAAALLIFRRRN